MTKAQFEAIADQDGYETALLTAVAAASKQVASMIRVASKRGFAVVNRLDDRFVMKSASDKIYIFDSGKWETPDGSGTGAQSLKKFCN